MFVRRIRPSRSEALPEPSHVLRDMERLFDAVWGRHDGAPTAGVFPAVNVSRDEGSFYVRAELPGVSTEDLRITVEGRKLGLAGHRTTHEAEGSYHRRERASGSFDRTITLPAEFDASRVEAAYRDGILKITLPLSESAKGRRIAVQTA